MADAVDPAFELLADAALDAGIPAEKICVGSDPGLTGARYWLAIEGFSNWRVELAGTVGLLTGPHAGYFAWLALTAVDPLAAGEYQYA